MMQTIKQISKFEFHKLLCTQVDRVWDVEQKEGLTIRQAEQKGLLGDVQYIFVRDDLWSIGSSKEGFEECRALWEDSWIQVFAITGEVEHLEEKFAAP